jgi:ligand-binding sensor domain-containing protein/class 3 adenylate cyclase
MVGRSGRILLLLVAGLLQSLTCRAQHFFFENIAVRDGLPASKVYAVLQDSTGLIWVGTEAGLASYDGLSVKTYSVADDLAPSGARSLFLDRDQRLWVGHLGGGISLREGNRFHVVKFGKDQPSRDISGIAQDASGAIWIATFGNGAYRIGKVGGDDLVKAEHFQDAQGIAERITGITRLNNGKLLFLEAQGGMKIWDPAKSAFTAFEPKGLPMLMNITCVFQDSKDRLWIGTQSAGAICLDTKDGKTTTYDISTAMPSNFIMAFGEDLEGNIWVGTWDNGLARIEPHGIRRFNMGNGTHSQRMRCMARDREGNMLIGTHDAGLEVYKGDRFRSFTEADHLVDKQVWAILESRDGHLWFGTNGGITILSTEADGASTVRHLTMQAGQLTSNHVRALVEDAEGHVWIGTEDGGLFDFNPNSFQPSYSMEVAGSIAENKVTALATGAPGELWVGTINGLVHVERGKMPVLLHVPDGITGEYVSALFRDRKGTLWVGSTGAGISRIVDGKATPLKLASPVSPTCFTEDAQGRLWVGTEGRGIMVFRNGALATTYDAEDGLISNSIRSLITDRNGHVWIGTNRGLNEWKPGEDKFVRYTERSGFTGIEAKPNSVAMDAEGNLWFGTANGAMSIAPRKGPDLGVPPLVAIRGLKVNLEDRPWEDGIELNHTESNIRIEYGSVSLDDPEAVRYQYYLEGLDQDWQPLTGETDVHYPSLPAGHYVFKVKAMGRTGLFSIRPAEFRFTILPPWYRSWWFLTIVGIVLVSGTVSYVKLRERQLRMRNQILEQRVEERTAEVRAKSDEIAGQKVRIEELLLNILPKAVSDELKDTGKATAKRFDHVTVMFTDMKGFTTMAEKMTPEQLVAELDECFVRFDRITARYGIEKIKTIGDSYMSACGLPTPVEHHALRAVLAALDVREEMVRWQAERDGTGKAPWVLRIGLHSGPVVAGVVGKRKFAYDIWGDTVNTASRMESSGSPGEVNISGSTHELVKDHFVCEHRGQVEAKNKGKIDMYFVRRIAPQYSADAQGLKPNERFLEEMGLAVGEMA